MTIAIGQAAKAVGKSKEVIRQAIAAGRLPAKKDKKNQWRIDPEILFKIYPPLEQKNKSDNRNPAHDLALENHRLRTKLNDLEERFQALKDECEKASQDARKWKDYTQKLISFLAEHDPKFKKIHFQEEVVSNIPRKEHRFSPDSITQNPDVELFDGNDLSLEEIYVALARGAHDFSEKKTNASRRLVYVSEDTKEDWAGDLEMPFLENEIDEKLKNIQVLLPQESWLQEELGTEKNDSFPQNRQTITVIHQAKKTSWWRWRPLGRSAKRNRSRP